jgi:hypothetical protein
MNIQGSIYISSSMAASLGVSSQPTICIRAGNRVVRTRITVRPGKNKTYMLSPKLLQVLCLKQRQRLQLRYDHEADMLHIGPIIGIFTTAVPSDDSIRADLIFLSNIGRGLPALIYVFTPYSIDWRQNLVRGYTFRKVSETQGTWVSELYPLPDVVYDRIASRRSESRALVRDAKKRLMSLPYLKYFNSSFLNKWRVHQLLLENEQLQPHLPETRPLNSENLAEMLQKYATVFLKPSNGSLGRGIIKVVRKEKRLKYTVYKNNITHGIVENHIELLNKTRLVRNGRPYIVQQGINLITYNQAPFDIRVIYQKNGKGEWQVAKKFVRVAPKGSSISNLSSGGYAEKLDHVYASLYPRNKRKIREQQEQINNLCHMAATTLEEVSGCIFGELGLDIGLDTNHFPWLIEVNSKPRKSTTTRFSQAIVRNSFKRPLEFAVYLAGFKKTGKAKTSSP